MGLRRGRRNEKKRLGAGEQQIKRNKREAILFIKTAAGAPAHQRVGQTCLGARWIRCFALLPVCLLKHGITYLTPFAGDLVGLLTCPPPPDPKSSAS